MLHCQHTGYSPEYTGNATTIIKSAYGVGLWKKVGQRCCDFQAARLKEIIRKRLIVSRIVRALIRRMACA